MDKTPHETVVAKSTGTTKPSANVCTRIIARSVNGLVLSRTIRDTIHDEIVLAVEVHNLHNQERLTALHAQQATSFYLPVPEEQTVRSTTRQPTNQDSPLDGPS